MYGGNSGYTTARSRKAAPAGDDLPALPQSGWRNPQDCSRVSEYRKNKSLTLPYGLRESGS